jgi:hypothetical protein
MSGGRRGRGEGVRRNEELTKAAFSVAFLWGIGFEKIPLHSLAKCWHAFHIV